MLTAREASVRRMVQVYEVIVAFVDRYGYAPSYRDIACACGLASTSSVGYWLNKLEAEGLITRPPGKARSISVKGTRHD